MNFVPYMPQKFIVSESIRFDEQFSTTKQVSVTLVTLAPLGDKCPQISLAPLVNISKIDSYTRLFPNYVLYC
jgi:hypothetical protein